MIFNDTSRLRDAGVSNEYKADSNPMSGMNPLLITDKFLATERAACASLEMRLRNLAEKAASRTTFTEANKPSHWHRVGSLSNSPPRIKCKLLHDYTKGLTRNLTCHLELGFCS